MKNGVIGVAIASAIALAISPVSIAGIAAWKIVLAAVGAVLVVTAGRSGESGKSGRASGR